jgi:hypothetical protein
VEMTVFTSSWVLCDSEKNNIHCGEWVDIFLDADSHSHLGVRRRICPKWKPFFTFI